MRKVTSGTLMALFCLLSLSSAAAGETYLVRIFCQTGDQISDTYLPVYAYFDDYLIAGAEPEDLTRIGLRYEILDNRPWTLPYWLVSSRPGEPLEIETTQALFVEEGIALLKMNREEAEKLAQKRYEITRLYPVPLPPRRSRPPIPEQVLVDPFIQSLVVQVSDSSLVSFHQRLEDFRTRYSHTDSCRAAEQWLYDQLSSMGLDVEFHYYPAVSDTWRNVVATLPGTVDSTKIFIICGHMDSISEDPWFNAPGADDNASGTVLVLEAARILSQYSFDYTARFICFSGEEQGLYGSYYYATMADSLGMDIGGVLNFDMVAYCDDSLFDFAVLSNQDSRPLLNLLISAANTYAALDPYDPHANSGASDHWWFQQYGYQAIFAIEMGRTHGNPYYHTSGDVLATLTIPFEREMAKAGIATLACLIADFPMPPSGLRVVDAGSGDALWATWSPNSEPGLAGYFLHYGTQSGQYGPPVWVGTDTTWLLTGLSEGVRYYLALTARDTLNRESGYSLERSAVPYSIPAPPSGLAAAPLNRAVELTWLPNVEGDLRGYNVHRSMTTGGGYTVVSPSVVTDTTFIDTAIAVDTIYYYVLTALDTSGNESGYSGEVSCAPMWFDSGILLVDETTNGPGDPWYPNDAQVDSFYHSILQAYSYTDWENSDGSNPPGLLDVRHYSTIVWHSDDYFHHYLPGDTSVLRQHLHAGGNLWLLGFKNLTSLGAPYPGFYAAGDFPYDCLHLSWASEQFENDFIGANGLLGYASLQVDSLRVPPPWEGKLRNINIVTPLDSETIYTFNSASGDTSYQDHPCGVRWLGQDHKVVFFAFPLYCMEGGPAGLVAQKVMADFGEPAGVAELSKSQLPIANDQLFQNYPNPFSTTTTIPFHLTRGHGDAETRGHLSTYERINLSVYDLSGRLVKTLIDCSLPTAYSLVPTAVSWDGRDSSGQPVASGVYFYRLSTTRAGTGASRFVDVKKAVVVR